MKTYRFDPAHEIRHIVLAGCGGTGAHLARSIARLLYDMDQRGLKTPSATFVDPDHASLGNVGRQLWTVADALSDPPLNKAETLARRFNLALGMSIEWDPTPFDPGKYDNYGTFIVGAVDNHLARRAMAETNRLWLDMGNHFSSGQLVLGTTGDPVEVARAFDRCDEQPDRRTVSQLPNAALLFPQLLEPEEQADVDLDPDLSCAELVQRGEQMIFINDLMAAAAAQVIYRLLHRMPLDSHITYVDAETITLSSRPISREGLSAYGL